MLFLPLEKSCLSFEFIICGLMIVNLTPHGLFVKCQTWKGSANVPFTQVANCVDAVFANMHIPDNLTDSPCYLVVHSKRVSKA